MSNEETHLPRSTTGAAAWLTLANLTSNAGTVAYFMVAARVLGTQDMGVITLMAMISALFMAIACAALPQALTKFVATLRGRNQYNAARNVMRRVTLFGLCSSIIFGGITWILAPQLAFLAALSTAESATLFQFLSVDVSLVIFVQFLHGSLRGNQALRESAIVTLASTLVKSLLAILLLLSGIGVIGVVIAWTIGDSAGVSIALYYSMLHFGGVAKGFVKIRNLLSFSGPMLASDLLQYANSTMDRYMILVLAGTSALGLYSPAVTAASFVMTMPNAVSNALFPRFAELEGSGDSKSEYERDASRMITLIFLPMAFGLASVSLPVILLLAGERYAASALALGVLSVVMGLTCLSSLVNSRLMAKGTTAPFLIASMIAFPVSMFVGFVSIPLLGSTGAALSRASLLVTLFVIPAVHLHKQGSIVADRQAMRDGLLSSLLMVVSVGFVQILIFDKLLLPLYIAIGIIVYSISLRCLGTVNECDLEIIGKLIPSRVSSLRVFLRKMFLNQEESKMVKPRS